MLKKRDIKYLFRSGSWRFMRESRNGRGRGGLSRYVWRGRPIQFRIGTSDANLIYNILCKRGRKGEYWLPDAVAPRVIFDIGANIGIASVYLANRFPQATIFSFEPVPDNFALLQANVAAYPNVHPCPIALGANDGEIEMFYSDDPANEGGYSLYRQGVDAARTVRAAMRTPTSFMRERGLAHIDMIKIDTEGSEHGILTAFDPTVLRTVKWITGELHGERDFEVLNLLSQWFDIGMRKSIKSRLFNFTACNKAITPTI